MMTNFVSPQLRVKCIDRNAALHAARYDNYLGYCSRACETNRHKQRKSKKSIHLKPAVNRQPMFPRGWPEELVKVLHTKKQFLNDKSWRVHCVLARPGASRRPDASWRILTRQEAPRRARTCCQPGLVLDHPGSSWICLDQLGSSWIILDYPGPAWTCSCSGSSWIIMDQPGRDT